MNSSVDPNTIKLFRVRKTVFKMLRKRGYAVSNEDMNMTLEQFLIEVINEKMIIISSSLILRVNLELISLLLLYIHIEYNSLYRLVELMVRMKMTVLLCFSFVTLRKR